MMAQRAGSFTRVRPTCGDGHAAPSVERLGRFILNDWLYAPKRGQRIRCQQPGCQSIYSDTEVIRSVCPDAAEVYMAMHGADREDGDGGAHPRILRGGRRAA